MLSLADAKPLLAEVLLLLAPLAAEERLLFAPPLVALPFFAAVLVPEDLVAPPRPAFETPLEAAPPRLGEPFDAVPRPEEPLLVPLLLETAPPRPENLVALLEKALLLLAPRAPDEFLDAPLLVAPRPPEFLLADLDIPFEEAFVAPLTAPFEALPRAALLPRPAIFDAPFDPDLELLLLAPFDELFAAPFDAPFGAGRPPELFVAVFFATAFLVAFAMIF